MCRERVRAARAQRVDRLKGTEFTFNGNGAVDLPLVCPSCSLVHRVSTRALGAPSVTCPHCGHARASADVKEHIPRDLSLLRPAERPARLSEFPLRSVSGP